MLLQNLKIPGHDEMMHIGIRGDKIGLITPDLQLTTPGKRKLNLEFENVIAFPGLINSHDHLDFNLFSQTGNMTYKNYREWGEDIQSNNRKDIEAILVVPKNIRSEWGMYKNLINGITTVVNHGDYLNIEKPVIDVFQRCYSLHSVRQKLWRLKLNRPFVKHQPFVVHAGEGTDTASFEEINELIRWNLFKRKMIAVHGVAMSSEQAGSFEALIWCPGSNFFMLNATANITELKRDIKILFGTDSTLSASWNIWEQLRLAKSTKMLTGEELFNSLTSLPANVWRLNDRGAFQEGRNADIVIARMKIKNSFLESFFQTDPGDILLVIRKGEIILFDETLYSALSGEIAVKQFSSIPVKGSTKRVKGDLPALINETKRYVSKLNVFDYEL